MERISLSLERERGGEGERERYCVQFSEKERVWVVRKRYRESMRE